MFFLFRAFRKISLKINLFFMKKKGLVIGKNCSFTGFPNFGSEPYLISIGDNVTIAGSSSFITHDGAKRVADNYSDFLRDNKIIKFGKISIGNNVFIGYNSIILPNVEIGNNVIVAAGSVVTKSLLPNCVYGGVPAKKIMSIDEYVENIVNNGEVLSEIEIGRYKNDKKNFILSKIEKQ